jgi:hypothetical protein
MFLVVTGCKRTTIVSDSILSLTPEYLKNKIVQTGNASVYRTDIHPGTTVVTNPMFVESYNEGNKTLGIPDAVVLSFGTNEGRTLEYPIEDFIKVLDMRIMQLVDRGARCFVFLESTHFGGMDREQYDVSADRIDVWFEHINSLEGDHTYFNRPYSVRVADIQETINSNKVRFTTDTVHLTVEGSDVAHDEIVRQLETCPSGRWNNSEALKDGETIAKPLHIDMMK